MNAPGLPEEDSDFGKSVDRTVCYEQSEFIIDGDGKKVRKKHPPYAKKCPPYAKKRAPWRCDY